MKSTSKAIMGATLVMVVTLAIVLALTLVLLAELYCSLLLRRRQLRKNNSNNSIPITTTTQTATITMPPSHAPHSQPPQPFTNNIYSQGVLQAPRSFFFPCKEEPKTSPRGNGLVSVSSSSPLASFLARAPPHHHQQEDSLEVQGRSGSYNENDSDVLCVVDDRKYSCGGGEHLVYICNPIYENEEGGKANTPFETPHTSPSCLEKSASSMDDDGDESDDDDYSPPPLTPMKKLPAEASSVSLRDATSLGTSCSDSHSINCPSSSSSDSPRTSPSW